MKCKEQPSSWDSGSGVVFTYLVQRDEGAVTDEQVHMNDEA